MKNLPRYAKALVAAGVAGAAALGVALDDGSITAVEGIAAACAALTALGSTWAVPNRPADTSATPTTGA